MTSTAPCFGEDCEKVELKTTFWKSATLKNYIEYLNSKTKNDKLNLSKISMSKPNNIFEKILN